VQFLLKGNVKKRNTKLRNIKKLTTYVEESYMKMKAINKRHNSHNFKIKNVSI